MPLEFDKKQLKTGCKLRLKFREPRPHARHRKQIDTCLSRLGPWFLTPEGGSCWYVYTNVTEEAYPDDRIPIRAISADALGTNDRLAARTEYIEPTRILPPKSLLRDVTPISVNLVEPLRWLSGNDDAKTIPEVFTTPPNDVFTAVSFLPQVRQSFGDAPGGVYPDTEVVKDQLTRLQKEDPLRLYEYLNQVYAPAPAPVCRLTRTGKKWKCPRLDAPAAAKDPLQKILHSWVRPSQLYPLDLPLALASLTLFTMDSSNAVYGRAKFDGRAPFTWEQFDLTVTNLARFLMQNTWTLSDDTQDLPPRRWPAPVLFASEATPDLLPPKITEQLNPVGVYPLSSDMLLCLNPTDESVFTWEGKQVLLAKNTPASIERILSALAPDLDPDKVPPLSMHPIPDDALPYGTWLLLEGMLGREVSRLAKPTRDCGAGNTPQINLIADDHHYPFDYVEAFRRVYLRYVAHSVLPVFV